MEGIRVLDVAPPPADQRLHYGADSNQFLDLRMPKAVGAVPLVFYIHGGFWRARYDLTHGGWPCSALAATGFATCNVEYRRAGSPRGAWPASLQDIRAAWQFLSRSGARYRYDLGRAIVMGHSAGGQLALAFAAHQPAIMRVVSLAGVLDLRRAWELHLSNDAVVEFLGGTPEQAPEHYREADPMQLKLAARQAIVCGSGDTIVPPDFSRHYVEHKRSQQQPAELIEIRGADHFALIDPQSPAWPQVVAVAKALLA